MRHVPTVPFTEGVVLPPTAQKKEEQAFYRADLKVEVRNGVHGAVIEAYAHGKVEQGRMVSSDLIVWKREV